MRIEGKQRYEQFRGRYHSGLLSGLASAHAATAGFFWLINEVGSGSLVIVRRVLFGSPFPAATSTAIARVTAERCTFSGAASGASGVPAPYDSQEVLPSSVSIRTASTGLTLVAGAAICTGLMGQALDATPTGSRAEQALQAIYDDQGNRDRAQLLRAGEGMVIRQADNGDTDERAIVDVEFEVFQLAG